MSFIAPDFDLLVRDFSPGFIDAGENNLIPPGSTPDAKNALFDRIWRDDRGAIRASMMKRTGSRLVTPTAMSAGHFTDGLHEYVTEAGTRQLLAVCDGQLYRYDGVATMNAVAGAVGFTPDSLRARKTQLRNQAFLFDGAAQWRYNGTAAFAWGVAKPTGAPALATAAGPGVTGTYEGFAVWYDSTTDHESSPSNISVAVVFANQQRQWSKPAGAPPSNVDNWRVYCRRIDTNERNYFRVGTVAIATATLTEAVSDTARRILGPLDQSNDPPPVTFALCEVWQDFGIAFALDGSDMYVSKQGDLESWHPDHKFPIAKGESEPVRSVVKLGEDILIQKPLRSFTLEGDRVPFRIRDLETGYGSVCPAIVADRRIWGWDQERGPYWTDRLTWTLIADDKLMAALPTVNPNYLSRIRIAVCPGLHLILFAVPTDGTGRVRTIFPYHYRLGSWLPPMTGLEYASFALFTVSGRRSFYGGDLWGRIYELFTGDAEGVPVGTTIKGTVVSATANTVTIAPTDPDGSTLYVTGHGLKGLPVAARSPGGQWEWRRILSNTGTVITLDTTFDTVWKTTPLAGWTIVIGGIEWHWWTPDFDGGRPDVLKRGGWLGLAAKSTSSTFNLEVDARFNNEESPSLDRTFTFPTGTLSGVWGVMVWGKGVWSSILRKMRKRRLKRSFFSVQLRLRNYYANQPMHIVAIQVGADFLPRRRVGGV